MFTEEKKKNRKYGSIFLYCFFCFALVVEASAFGKAYTKNLEKLEALVEEGFEDAEGICNSVRSSRRSASSVPSAQNNEKLSIAIRREDRTRPPSSYCIKFNSFATMAKLVQENGDKYESRPFSAGGYNWTLIIHPNQNKPVGSGAFVSMYVRIDNSTLIANPRDVYAEIIFMAYRRSTDKYHFLQETDAQRFHLFQQEWGQLNFLQIAYLTNPTYGYLFDGEQSVLGVDILVSDPFENWESFSYEQNIRDPIFQWRVDNFTSRDLFYYTAGWFHSGGRSWELKMYPNGVGTATGNSLSLFLLTTEENKNSYVKAKLRIIDQLKSNHAEKEVEGWPNATDGWGFDKFIPLADLKDSSKGFVVEDTLLIEVELLSFTKTDSF